VRGHVRRRGARWQTVVEIGEQPAQVCPPCKKVYWLDNKRRERCPLCGGELEDVRRRRQNTQSGYNTKKEAEAALQKQLVARREGTYCEPDKTTVSEYLKEWLPAIEHTLRPNSYHAYKGDVDSHIAEHLGRIPLGQLHAGHINAMYASLAEQGLSPATRRRIHRTLHRALHDAVRWGRLRANPAAAADPPRVTAPEMKTWSGQQLRQFLDHVADDRLHPLWRTMALTGMRRGEALGLKLGDIDLDAARLNIRRARVQVGYEVRESEPKTKRSARMLPLDAETVVVLRSWLERQAGELGRLEAKQTADTFLFTNEAGEPLHPDRARKCFETAQARVRKEVEDLPRIRLHDLRHTFATLALSAGINPKVVADRLGHSTVSMTLDRYSHVLPALQESAVELVAALVDRR